MSKYLLVLGAPDGASNASFQPVADAMAKGFGEPVPFLVWTDSQLAGVPANSETLWTLVAPFKADWKSDPNPQIYLYVIAGNDVTGPSPGNVAMDAAIASEEAINVLRGIIYLRVVNNEAEAASMPGNTLNPLKLTPSPILAFQKVADGNPTRLAMRQITIILGKPPGTGFSVPVLNQAIPGQGSISTTHLAMSPQEAATPEFMPNLAFQLAVALSGSSGGSGGGGPLIEPKPGAKPDAAKKQASFFSNPLVLGVGAVGLAYFLFFRKSKGSR